MSLSSCRRILRNCFKRRGRTCPAARSLEGYRTQALTRGQVGRLLGLNFWETEAFLKQKQAYLPYNESDLDRDRQAIDRALSE